MDVSRDFLCVENKTNNGLSCQKWLRHSHTQPILTANFWIPFNRSIQNRETIPSIQMWRSRGKQMLYLGWHLFYYLEHARHVFLGSMPTRRMFIDSRGRAIVHVWSLSWVKKLPRFENSVESDAPLGFGVSQILTQGESHFRLDCFLEENSNKISTLIKWHLANLVLRNGFYTIVFEI